MDGDRRSCGGGGDGGVGGGGGGGGGGAVAAGSTRRPKPPCMGSMQSPHCFPPPDHPACRTPTLLIYSLNAWQKGRSQRPNPGCLFGDFY